MLTRQVPGESWTFRRRSTKQEDTGILPNNKGGSNDFAYWSAGGHDSNSGSFKSKLFARLMSEDRRRRVGNRGVPQPPKNYQAPGGTFIFTDRQTGETDTGILPFNYGETNDFARWHPHPKQKNGGSWQSRKLGNARVLREFRGESNGGLRTRMMILLRRLNSTARLVNEPLLLTTPDQMVSEWLSQNGKCAACKGPLSLRGTRKGCPQKERGACYDHNHETGEPRGFIHSQCNMAEGHILQMSDEEFKNYITWVSTIHNRGQS
jgi:hypothetical protein